MTRSGGAGDTSLPAIGSVIGLSIHGVLSAGAGAA
jgi:hypothetical protein